MKSGKIVGETWVLRLNDGSAPNNFEAAMRYSYRGKIYYFPGGTNDVYSNRDYIIVGVFQSMSWYKIILVDHDNNPTTKPIPRVGPFREVHFDYGVYNQAKKKINPNHLKQATLCP